MANGAGGGRLATGEGLRQVLQRALSRVVTRPCARRLFELGVLDAAEVGDGFADPARSGAAAAVDLAQHGHPVTGGAVDGELVRFEIVDRGLEAAQAAHVRHPQGPPFPMAPEPRRDEAVAIAPERALHSERSGPNRALA